MEGTGLHLLMYLLGYNTVTQHQMGQMGTTLCLSYLARLLSCVKIEECQMSGFSTENCISVHLKSLFPCSLQPYAVS